MENKLFFIYFIYNNPLANLRKEKTKAKILIINYGKRKPFTKICPVTIKLIEGGRRKLRVAALKKWPLSKGKPV
jgi:hypothetical protein